MLPFLEKGSSNKNLEHRHYFAHRLVRSNGYMTKEPIRTIPSIVLTRTASIALLGLLWLQHAGMVISSRFFHATRIDPSVSPRTGIVTTSLRRACWVKSHHRKSFAVTGIAASFIRTTPFRRYRCDPTPPMCIHVVSALDF
jgi:hypothetical protein